MYEVLWDLSGDLRVEHFLQGCPKYSEKRWTRRENHSVKKIVSARAFEFDSDLPCEQYGLMLSRAPLSAGAVMCHGSATPTPRSVIEDAAGTVRLKVTVVQVCTRIRELPG